MTHKSVLAFKATRIFFRKRSNLISGLFLIAIALWPSISVGHPLKLSASLIEYDHKKKFIRMECRVFLDDFQLSLSSSVLKGRERTKLKESEKPRIIEAYFKDLYHITVNGKRIRLKFDSMKYMQAQNVLEIKFARVPLSMKKGDKIEIKNMLFFDDFGSQQSNRMALRIPHFGINQRLIGTIYEPSFSFKMGDLK
ncbi:MAG: DUF6702 family protein [Myxococcota bacterium]|nr:DUF6702 family protein [Myxococcota bacterium]